MLFLRILVGIISFAFITSPHQLTAASCQSPNQEWVKLKSGNRKFVKNSHYAKERKKLVAGQNPACVVLGCSDSRVPPEIVFQQGLGELFTVRVAGEVADDVVVDSIEYAVTHYDVALIVVLGHSDCGAVIGALKHLRENGGVIDTQVGHLHAVLIPIERAIVEAGIDIYAPDALEQSIVANIQYVASQLLLQSSPIAEAVQSGRIQLIGAQYLLASGRVDRLFVW